MAKAKSIILNIDMKEMERYRRERIEKVAEHVDPDTLANIMSRCRNIINNPVDIDEYRGFAEGLAEVLDRAYDEVGNPNMFHHPLKQISPEIYGTPDTLRAQCRSLLEDLDIARRLQIRAKGGK